MKTVKLKVSLEVPISEFVSEYDDPKWAAEAFCEYLRDTWTQDLKPLAALGIGISVRIDPSHPDNPKRPGIEIDVEPYNPEIFDMMKKTRELLTEQEEVWKKFSKSPAAMALYK